MQQFTGLFTALITPFNEDFSINKKKLVELVEQQIEAGVDGVVPCGTTGEAPTLSEDEHMEVIRITVEAAKGRCLVVAGTGANCTREAIVRTQNAFDLGVDGSLQIVPYYNKPSQEGLFEHFKAIAEAVPTLPIMLYNVPGRTGVNMTPETILRLAEIENIVAIKEASGDIKQVEAICSQKPADFTVLSGDDGLALAFSKVGTQGLVSVASNVYPEEMVAFVKLLQEKNYSEAEKINDKYHDFFEACFIAGNPASVKYMMKVKGFCDCYLRLPLYLPEPAKRQRIEEVMAKL